MHDFSSPLSKALSSSFQAFSVTSHHLFLSYESATLHSSIGITSSILLANRSLRNILGYHFTTVNKVF